MIKLGCKLLVYGSVVLVAGVVITALGPVGAVGAVLVGLALSKKK